jgi:hypothetical protein
MSLSQIFRTKSNNFPVVVACCKVILLSAFYFKDLEPHARDQAKNIVQMLEEYENSHSRDTACNSEEVCAHTFS